MKSVIRYWQCQTCGLTGRIEHGEGVGNVKARVIKAHNDALKRSRLDDAGIECEYARICHWVDADRIQEVEPGDEIR